VAVVADASTRRAGLGRVDMSCAVVALYTLLENLYSELSNQASPVEECN
jgi:hypothetical protein